jgi:serine/threonine protein kinase
LKPQNIFIKKATLEVKIGDFGFASKYQGKAKRNSLDVSTLQFSPPELLLRKAEYDLSMDIWSLGCIFAQLHTSEVLFNKHFPKDQLIHILQTLGFILSPTTEMKQILSPNNSSIPFSKDLTFLEFYSRFDFTVL